MRKHFNRTTEVSVSAEANKYCNNVGTCNCTSTHLKTPSVYFTIEDQLESFAKDQRFSYLWTNWRHERGEYIEKLKTIQNTFPEYSLHDEKHSRKILISIERILGPDRIRLLSPSDAWLILQCAYSHDIGMNVSAEESKLFITRPDSEDFQRLISDPFIKKQFQEIIDELLQRDGFYERAWFHDEGRAAAHYWQTNLNKLFSSDNRFVMAAFGQDFTNASFFYSILIMEGFRRMHAKRSKEELKKLIDINVEYDPIPRHMRESVAEINECHAGPPNCVMRLEPKQNGFCGDYYHARFIAALLRLGDLMDIESTRFNPYLIKWRGMFSSDNMAYMIKDLSVVSLMLDCEKVFVTSSFDTNQVRNFLSRHKSEKEEEPDIAKARIMIGKSIKYMRSWMNHIQSNFTEYIMRWDEIAPRDMPPGIPVPGEMTILFDGVEVNPRDIDLKYEIDTRRAAEVIEGSGLYKEARLVFLREVIQNAVDATKAELLSGPAFNRFKDLKKSDAQPTFSEFLEDNGSLLKDYKVEVVVKLDIDKMTVTITDKGIGITRDRLSQMLHIGATRDKTMQKRSKDSPEWFRPTATFGIGLQSVFQIADQFEIKSNPREFELIGDKKLAMQRWITLSSVKVGGDITSRESDMENHLEPDPSRNTDSWDEGTRYPHGSRVIISIKLTEANDFVKSESGHWINGETVEYTYNLRKMLGKKIRSYLQRTLTDDIIPIHVQINGTEEEELNFETTPFGKAKHVKGHANLRVLDNDVYFWYETPNAEDNKAFIALFKLSVRRSDFCQTQLFFRGINFKQSGEVFRFDADELFPGFDCDVNIMSGDAQDFLKINRDKLKEVKERDFRVKMIAAATEFYTEINELISDYLKQTLESDSASNADKTEIKDDGVFKDFMNHFEKWLYSSTAFSRNLLIYSKIKGRFSEAFMTFMTRHCGGTIDIVQLDKHSGKVALVNEPILGCEQSFWQEDLFVDAKSFEKGRVITLAEDLRLTDANERYVICKRLSDAYPIFAEYKFKKIEVFACDTGGYIAFYNLSEPDKMGQMLTEIDPDSYRIITTEILEYYTKRCDNGDQMVDRSHFPVFPAARSDQFDRPLSSAINVLAVREQVADENPRCDRRYNGFVISPLPIGKLVELRRCGKRLDKVQARTTIETLWKEGWQNDEGMKECAHKNELPQLYEQLNRFITMKRFAADSHQSGEDQQRNEILDAWAEFTVFLLSLP